MIFQDNIIKEYLRNVYFITGTPCGGKTTVSRALGAKYGIPVYDIDEQFAIHQARSDKEYQPNMNRQFKDADEFFGRTTEDYQKWLINNTREQFDFVLLDLMRLSQNGRIICDCHLTLEQADMFTDPSRVVFMMREPIDLVEEYCDRPDHQGFKDYINSATDPKAAKANCNETLMALNSETYRRVKESDFCWIERDNNRSVDDTVKLVEKHFGWDASYDPEIKEVEKGSNLAEELIRFVKNSSWDEAKEHIAGLIRNWEFTDWETMFAAVVDERIVGMVSVMKTDYYPLPDISPWVSCLFIDEEYRGHRISEKLIAYANAYLRKQGFDISYIPTEHAGLFEHYGYHFVKDIVNYGGGTDHLYKKEL